MSNSPRGHVTTKPEKAHRAASAGVHGARETAFPWVPPGPATRLTYEHVRVRVLAAFGTAVGVRAPAGARWTPCCFRMMGALRRVLRSLSRWTTSRSAARVAIPEAVHKHELGRGAAPRGGAPETPRFRNRVNAAAPQGERRARGARREGSLRIQLPSPGRDSNPRPSGYGIARTASPQACSRMTDSGEVLSDQPMSAQDGTTKAPRRGPKLRPLRWPWSDLPTGP
jgi:hypothetical protein